MLKFIVGDVLVVLMILFVLTQVIIPAIFPSLGYFWLFKKKPKQTTPPTSLDKLDKKVDQSVKQFQETKAEVDLTAEKIQKIQNKIK